MPGSESRDLSAARVGEMQALQSGRAADHDVRDAADDHGENQRCGCALCLGQRRVLQHDQLRDRCAIPAPAKTRPLRSQGQGHRRFRGHIARHRQGVHARRHPPARRRVPGRRQRNRRRFHRPDGPESSRKMGCRVRLRPRRRAAVQGGRLQAHAARLLDDSRARPVDDGHQLYDTDAAAHHRHGVHQRRQDRRHVRHGRDGTRSCP